MTNVVVKTKQYIQERWRFTAHEEKHGTVYGCVVLYTARNPGRWFTTVFCREYDRIRTLYTKKRQKYDGSTVVKHRPGLQWNTVQTQPFMIKQVFVRGIRPDVSRWTLAPSIWQSLSALFLFVDPFFSLSSTVSVSLWKIHLSRPRSCTETQRRVVEPGNNVENDRLLWRYSDLRRPVVFLLGDNIRTSNQLLSITLYWSL